MKISEYENIFRNEDNHFYYVANHRIVLSLVNKYLGHKKMVRLLDVGCGTGLLAKKLAKFGKVSGVDIHEEAIKYARIRNVDVKKASITKLPFLNNSFDVVVCIDVLNHRWVKNERRALLELYRVLKPSGFLIIRASANKWLHLVHDKHVWLKKRYEKEDFERKLHGAGFTVKRSSYVNMMLLPMALLLSIFEKMTKTNKPTSAISHVSSLINIFFTFLLSLESYVLPFIDLPFGIALIAVCKKSDPNSKISN
ncbi:class I SAM-dependent methyltransferase [Candidatus Roizmanbacteria bacterium]|nr:class I SAM-dependent methyltransferase [Candidatus Roizmanbacteria bacterium]